MLPFLIGAGLVMRGIGQFKANMDQANAEDANASFYREQAEFARIAGERSADIFNRETKQLMGEIGSAYAKAGVDTTAVSGALAVSLLYRQQEEIAIKREADLNVRLAMLRANNSAKNASNLRDPLTNILQLGGSTLQAIGSMK
jgi:hypothetical protein